jgi:hypothetical protein
LPGDALIGAAAPVGLGAAMAAPLPDEVPPLPDPSVNPLLPFATDA